MYERDDICTQSSFSWKQEIHVYKAPLQNALQDEWATKGCSGEVGGFMGMGTKSFSATAKIEKDSYFPGEQIKF